MNLVKPKRDGKRGREREGEGGKERDQERKKKLNIFTTG